MSSIAVPASDPKPRIGLSEHFRTWWPAWLLTLGLGWLAVVPLFQLFIASFKTSTEADAAFTLNNYVRAFSDPTTYELLWTTVTLAALRVGIALVIGIFLAWIVARTDTPGRRFIEVLIWIKFFTPPLPMIVAWILIAGRTGLLNTALQDLGLIRDPLFNITSYWGIVFISTLQFAAFIFLLVLPAFQAMDATLEDSARITGASNFHILKDITVPLVLPAVLGAAFYTFIIALESFETELILGTPARVYVLSTQIFVLAEQYPSDLPRATALSSVFLLAILGVIALQMRMSKGKSFTTVSGSTYSTRVTPLGPWRWLTFGICLLYFAISTVLPFIVLVLGTFMKGWGLWGPNAFTLKHWEISLGDPRLMSAITNTIFLGILVGLGGTALCALAAYVIVRTKFIGANALELITWAPRVAPAPVLAIAFLWTYIGPDIFRPLIGTVWMLALVLIVNSIPLGARVASGAMHQISASLEEASWVAGSNWPRTFVRIILPLLAPSLLSSFVLLFLLASRNLSLILFFYGPESRVLASMVWENWSGSTPERALVAGLILMAISMAALAVALLIRRRTGLARIY
ncbi:MAG: ABC transporter permease [Chloroflexota bacterium]